MRYYVAEARLVDVLGEDFKLSCWTCYYYGGNSSRVGYGANSNLGGLLRTTANSELVGCRC